ncbi:hypothetical protein QBC34DRAFT_428395 [Podospora aff. communis PSN243]|uniref:Uncharacterized protein n=1 Tax=Podospora aff. communis PSN243 TaxID=3040156 RepID=A0AAV9GD92_9PEZI|nr:hypothetical protein QBC34DRAFT_428395 [Podospora aff. communis PSN243]
MFIFSTISLKLFWFHWCLFYRKPGLTEVTFCTYLPTTNNLYARHHKKEYNIEKDKKVKVIRRLPVVRRVSTDYLAKPVWILNPGYGRYCGSLSVAELHSSLNNANHEALRDPITTWPPLQTPWFFWERPYEDGMTDAMLAAVERSDVDGLSRLLNQYSKDCQVSIHDIVVMCRRRADCTIEGFDRFELNGILHEANLGPNGVEIVKYIGDILENWTPEQRLAFCVARNSKGRTAFMQASMVTRMRETVFGKWMTDVDGLDAMALAVLSYSRVSRQFAMKQGYSVNSFYPDDRVKNWGRVHQPDYKGRTLVSMTVEAGNVGALRDILGNGLGDVPQQMSEQVNRQLWMFCRNGGSYYITPLEFIERNLGVKTANNDGIGAILEPWRASSTTMDPE